MLGRTHSSINPSAPFYSRFWVVLIAAVYSGILSSTGSPAHVYNEYFEYESNIDATTGSIYLSQESGTKGLFSFKGNYLAYKGSVDGFTACVGDFYQIVVSPRVLVFCVRRG
jgi:hypothetical protein